ncbi:hypothetical protein TYRP_011745 [Tyrophagus putrescentiae]|nr:hypothetical protein TYRP_011745 [Tyrophagus putrescentiae]
MARWVGWLDEGIGEVTGETWTKRGKELGVKEVHSKVAKPGAVEVNREKEGVKSSRTIFLLLEVNVQRQVGQSRRPGGDQRDRQLTDGGHLLHQPLRTLHSQLIKVQQVEVAGGGVCCWSSSSSKRRFHSFLLFFFLFFFLLLLRRRRSNKQSQARPFGKYLLAKKGDKVGGRLDGLGQREQRHQGKVAAQGLQGVQSCAGRAK